jgi:lipopolysaccharide heptosyltransferase II
LRLSSLGDIVLTIPLIQALRVKYPLSRIDILVKKQFAGILKYVPELSNVFTIDTTRGSEGMAELEVFLKGIHYTHVLDLHSSLRTRGLRKKIGGKLLIVNKRSLKRWLLVTFKKNQLTDAPDVIGRYFEVAKELGVFDTGQAPILTLPKNLDTANGFRIAIAPGARHWNKRWPAEYFIEIAKRFIDEGALIELYGAAEDVAIASEIESALPPEYVQDFTGALTLEALPEQLRGVRLAITNDSGMMHVASACGVPVVAIFGPTVKDFGFAPRAKNATVVENAGLYCRPCTAVGREDCPEQHFECMRGLRPQMVIDAASVLVRNS